MTDSIDNRLRGMITQEPWDVLAQHRFRPQDDNTNEHLVYCECGWNMPSVSENAGNYLHGEHVRDQLAAGNWVVLPFSFIRGMSGTDDLRAAHYSAVSRAVAADIGPC